VALYSKEAKKQDEPRKHQVINREEAKDKMSKRPWRDKGKVDYASTIKHELAVGEALRDAPAEEAWRDDLLLSLSLSLVLGLSVCPTCNPSSYLCQHC